MAQVTTQSGATEITYRDAVREAIRDALGRDKTVFLMGDDVGRYAGCYALSMGLQAAFGPERNGVTALSDSGVTGAGVGSRMPGAQRIVEL